VSSYQQAGIPTDLKRKIAQLGINMLLKMVSRGSAWVPQLGTWPDCIRESI
jgi:hypothetical protein